MNHDFDSRLRERMLRLEATMPDAPMRRRQHRLRWSLPPLLVVGVLAFAAGVGASTLVQEGVRGSPGVFSPLGPLFCSDIQQRTPADAGPLLSQLGYEVTWQIEDPAANTSRQSTVAPPDGHIIEGVLHGRELLLVVERGPGATPANDPCPAAR